jgi:glycosyltransferase involved in cell wall biosynthesis
MKPIKVCFVAPYAWALFNPDSKTVFGGSEIQLHQLANTLAQDNRFEISFIVGDFGQDSPIHINNVTVYKGFKPDTLDKATSKFGLWIKSLWASIKLWLSLREINADIYIQRSAGGGTCIIALFCKLFAKKFVYMSACEIDVSKAYEKANKLRGKLFSWALNQAHLVFLQHQQQVELLLKKYNKTGVLMHSPLYNIQSDHNQPEKLTGKNSILWVGRADPCKQPELFLKLARQFPQEQFTMICQPAVYFGTLFEQIKKQAQDIKNLSFIEYVPFKEIERYFTQATLFINTSVYEGFPNTFIQTLKNHTPILSFKVNPSGFLTIYNCGLCAEGDFERLTQYLPKLLEDNSLRTQMAGNGFNYAYQNHNLNQAVSSFKELLISLINSSI